MLKVISWFVIGFVSNILYCYFFCKTLKQKFKITKNLLIMASFFSIINCYSIYYIPQIRPIIINLCVIVMCLMTYKKNFVLTTILGLYVFLLFAISEIVFVTIFIGLLKLDHNFMQNTVPGLFLSNIIIDIICFLILKIPILDLFKIDIDNWKTNERANNIILYTISVVTITILAIPLFSRQLNLNGILAFSSLTLFVVFFIFGFFSIQNKNVKLMKKYDDVIRFSKKYEKLIDEKCKQQHENKNQLVIVRSMIHKNNKKALDYIDKLLNIDLSKQDSDYINKLKNIPDGIKGLIYYKIEEMKNLGICIYLDVPNKINKNTKILCEENLTDLSRILGVYLDNAKEASASCNEKYVIIELKEEGNIIFTISNTYKDTINFERIDKPKFTSKGKGHGYGLSLVKDIIEKNDIFEQQREINGIYYVQSLILKQKDDISK